MDTKQVILELRTPKCWDVPRTAVKSPCNKSS